MLVKEPVQLTGYLSADESDAGFIVPLFSTPASNRLLVQEIGANGRIAGFREIDLHTFSSLERSDRQLSIGNPALWGFRTVDGDALIDVREVLRDYLTSRLGELDPPFLRLQAAQFCEDSEELVDAWRQAFEHLAERSPKSAQAWRDVVVIPTQMRLAVEQAILQHALDASVNRLSRTVDVAVDGGQLQLFLEPDLHAALMASAGARQSLEQAAAPIRYAFRLSGSAVALLVKDAEKADPYEVEGDDEVAIAGFGDMAISLIGQVVPRIRRVTGRASHLYPAPRGLRSMVLLQRAELDGHSDWGAGDPPRKLDERNRVLLITFQLGAQQSYLIDEALALADAYRRKGRIIIAVIPHLPNEFEEEGELSKAVIPTLNRHFDAVWALSDRSPYTRQALPYGPARSLQASAAHFRYLLRLAQREDTRHDLLADSDEPTRVNLIGSATGDRTVAKLTEHAMMRLAQNVLDFYPVSSVHVVGARRVDTPAQVREILRRDCPNAKIAILPTAKGDGGPDRISLILKGVGVRVGGPEQFERYCTEQLVRFGWDIDQFEPDGPIHISHRGIENLPTDCKYVALGMLDTALRSRTRRRYDVDGVLLTNASIRRRSFAMHVLNGSIPVHSSRIEALQRIYRRRFDYVLTYILQEKQTGARLLHPAALDWLNAHHWVDSKNIGRARLAPGCQAETAFAPRSVEITLPLEFVRGRGRNMVSVRGEAIVTLDESGWHLDQLAADGLDQYVG